MLFGQIPAVAKNSQVNIRFDDVTDAQLEQTAHDLGVSKSALVRHVTKTFLEEVRRTGALKLKPEWTRLIGDADGRSPWGEHKMQLNEGGERAEAADLEMKPVKYPSKKSPTKKSDN